MQEYNNGRLYKETTMKDLVINVQSAVSRGKFTGMIQSDDGVTSIATRYTDQDKFLAALEVVYDYVPKSELELAAE